MKIWSTKCVLSNGISEHEVQKTTDEWVCIRNTNSNPTYLHRNQWHSTKEEALKKAEDMRIKKIASLKKQIAKLEALKFDV